MSKLRFTLATVGALIASSPALAAAFSSGNLVIMRVNNTNASGANAFYLDEFTRTGAAVGNSIAIDSSASGATIGGATVINDDRHLHRSPNGQYLTFAGYGVAPSAVDPGTTPAASTPRVVGIVNQAGAVDLSTRLTDAYNGVNIRGAIVGNDGNSIWTAGDNGGDTTITGGIRYATRGGSTTNNLSRTQTNGGSPQADNIRDVNIFGGQLWDSSGSGSSVGKGVHQVGTGLPTTGAQTITAWTADAVSTSSFYMVDSDSDTVFETMYAVAPSLVRKYVLAAGVWVPKGSVALTNALQVVASVEPGGAVTVFAGGAGSVISFVDPNPASGSITGLTTTTIVSAPAGYTLGGIEFTPTPEPTTAIMFIVAGAILRRR